MSDPGFKTKLIESVLQVKDKQGRIIPFKLNSIQRRFIAERSGRDVILKLRQPGITTLSMANFFLDAACLNGIDVAIVAHKKTTDVLKPLRDKLEIFLRSCERNAPELLRGCTAQSADYIAWEDRHSSFRILSGGTNSSPLQSSTVHRVHFTELALWEGDVEEAITGALDSVPEDGQVVFESRGSSPSGWFYDFYWASKRGETGYKTHFYGTQDFPEYSAEFLESKRREYQGRSYLFKQHYPETDVEAFQASPYCYFADCPLEIGCSEQEPIEGRVYVIAADIGTGTPGGDPSAFVVLDILTGEIVKSGIRLERPRDFALYLFDLSMNYNYAVIAPERNVEGDAVLGTLSDLNANLYIDSEGKRGIRTDSNTRPLMLQELAEALHQGALKVSSEEFIRQAKSFCLQRSGKYEANSGCHDDLVMAHALGNYAAQRLYGVSEIVHPGRGGEIYV